MPLPQPGGSVARFRHETVRRPSGDEVPDWLRHFDAGTWAHPADAALDWIDQSIRERRRWEAAGRAWLAEHGLDTGAWFALTRPGPVVDPAPRLEEGDLCLD
jgi:hypothetical protein